jgi:hypothetical protein
MSQGLTISPILMLGHCPTVMELWLWSKVYESQQGGKKDKMEGLHQTSRPSTRSPQEAPGTNSTLTARPEGPKPPNDAGRKVKKKWGKLWRMLSSLVLIIFWPLTGYQKRPILPQGQNQDLRVATPGNDAQAWRNTIFHLPLWGDGSWALLLPQKGTVSRLSEQNVHLQFMTNEPLGDNRATGLV